MKSKHAIGAITVGIAVWGYVKYRQRRVPLSSEYYTGLEIIDKQKLTRDTTQLVLRHPQRVPLPPLRVLSHVMVKDDTLQIARAYTPIQADGETLMLGVREYVDGQVSSYLCTKQTGDVVECRGWVTTCDEALLDCERLVMVAGGTGITPMLQLLRYGSLRDKQLVLVYANKSKEDVMYAGEIESLKQHYGDQLTIVHSLDNVDGYLTPTIIKECAGNGDRIKFLVCGPDAFLRHVCGKKQSDTDQGPLGGILHRLGYTQHNVIKL